MYGGGEETRGIITCLRRTANAHILEMLAFAVRIVAGTTHRFKSTKGFLRIYLMAVSERKEAPGNVLQITRMIAIRLEHP
jgi:hypothetical protein